MAKEIIPTTPPVTDSALNAAREIDRAFYECIAGALGGTYVESAEAVQDNAAIITRHFAALSAERDAAIKLADDQMLLVKACESIAEGDEGWEKLRNECPSTMAVAALTERARKAEELLKASELTMSELAHLKSAEIAKTMNFEMSQDNHALRAQLAEARRDSERIDWLDEPPSVEETIARVRLIEPIMWRNGQALRKAIDAARTQ